MIPFSSFYIFKKACCACDLLSACISVPFPALFYLIGYSSLSSFSSTPSSLYMPLHLTLCLYFCAFCCSSVSTPSLRPTLFYYLSTLSLFSFSWPLHLLLNTFLFLSISMPFLVHLFLCILDFVSFFLIRALSLTSFFNLISLSSAPLPLIVFFPLLVTSLSLSLPNTHILFPSIPLAVAHFQPHISLFFLTAFLCSSI